MCENDVVEVIDERTRKSVTSESFNTCTWSWTRITMIYKQT